MNYSKGLIWLQLYVTKTCHLIVSSPVAQWEGVRHTWQAIADIIPQMKCTRHSSFTIQNTYGRLKWLPPLRLPIYYWPIYFYDLFIWSRWIHNEFSFDWGSSILLIADMNQSEGNRLSFCMYCTWHAACALFGSKLGYSGMYDCWCSSITQISRLCSGTHYSIAYFLWHYQGFMCKSKLFAALLLGYFYHVLFDESLLAFYVR